MAEIYPWQATLWQQLSGRPRHAHAYLLHGPAGIGKRALADNLVALLLCQHPANDRWKFDVFRAFFDGAMATGGAFLVTDAATRAVIGSTRYANYDEAASEIEIGWTFLARSHWGGRYNGEMKSLMLLRIPGDADHVSGAKAISVPGSC